MKEQRVYIETSAISYLYMESTPYRMRDTLKLWQFFRNAQVEVCLSSLTLMELSCCPEPKRGILLKYLSQIEYKLFFLSEKIYRLAEKLMRHGVIAGGTRQENLHLATALYYGLDSFVSWDYKQVVNPKTAMGIREVANLEKMEPFDILSPSFFLENRAPLFL